MTEAKNYLDTSCRQRGYYKGRDGKQHPFNVMLTVVNEKDKHYDGRPIVSGDYWELVGAVHARLLENYAARCEAERIEAYRKHRELINMPKTEPKQGPAPRTLRTSKYLRKERPDKDYLIALVEETGGNVKAMAKIYGRDREKISKYTMESWISIYDLGDEVQAAREARKAAS